jgi:hypothetical protein
LVRAICATRARWPADWLCGLRTNAHRELFTAAAWSGLPARRKSAANRRRTSSTASVAHPTTWNGSMQITACGARCRNGASPSPPP